MRAVVVAALLTLGACSNEGGIKIRIYAPSEPGVPQPDHVRLFIGLGEEMSTSISPQGFEQMRMHGTRWERDPANATDYLPITPPTPVEFDFTSNGEVPELGVVIAVGYTAGVPTSSVGIWHLEFRDGSLEVYEAGLNPSASAIASPASGDLNTLALWGPSQSGFDETCVYARDDRRDITDTSHRTSFIVTPNDRDCDGLLEDDPDPDDTETPRLDCDRNVFLGSREATRGEVSCLRTALAPGGNASCTLGGPPCVDGEDRDLSQCEPTRYCAETSLCAVCGADWTCARDVFAGRPAPPDVQYLKCEVRVTDPQSAGPTEICEGDSEPFAFATLLPAGVQCQQDQARMRNVDDGWDASLEDMYARYGVTITPACDLTFTGESLGSFPLGATTSGLIAVDLDNERGLALPIVFRPVAAGCELAIPPIKCHFVGLADDPARRACVGEATL